MTGDVERADDNESIPRSILAPLFHEHTILGLDTFIEAFDSLSNEHRFAILYLLYDEGELSAKEIGGRIEKTQNGLHFHLRKLVSAGLVENKRREQTDDGKRSYYKITRFGNIVATNAFAMLKEEKATLDQYSTSGSSP